jgi:hypothetical protein
MAEQVRAALCRIQLSTAEGTVDNPVDGGGARETLPRGLVNSDDYYSPVMTIKIHQ